MTRFQPDLTISLVTVFSRSPSGVDYSMGDTSGTDLLCLCALPLSLSLPAFPPAVPQAASFILHSFGPSASEQHQSPVAGSRPSSFRFRLPSRGTPVGSRTTGPVLLLLNPSASEQRNTSRTSPPLPSSFRFRAEEHRSDQSSSFILPLPSRGTPVLLHPSASEQTSSSRTSPPPSSFRFRAEEHRSDQSSSASPPSSFRFRAEEHQSSSYSE